MSIFLEKVKLAKIASIIYTEIIVVTWGQSKLKLAKGAPWRRQTQMMLPSASLLSLFRWNNGIKWMKYQPPMVLKELWPTKQRVR